MELNKKITEISNQKDLVYDKISMKLVKYTLADLRESNPMSKERFDEIITNIDDKTDILDVWHYISDTNSKLVSDIEISLRKNKADGSIIDLCNDAEDLVLVKYVMIKAIKAFLYEIMQANEQSSDISQEFQQK